MTELANRLKDLLASHDITQRKLARDIGVSDVTICRILNGRGNISLNVLVAIADYFSVSIDWLLGRE